MSVQIAEERLMKILLRPHISEKVSIIGDKYNQYAFKVIKCACKPEIKRAVEKMFNVKVESVRVLNKKAENKRVGRVMGKTKAWKKAYITLAEGNEIQFGGQA